MPLKLVVLTNSNARNALSNWYYGEEYCEFGIQFGPFVCTYERNGIVAFRPMTFYGNPTKKPIAFVDIEEVNAMLPNTISKFASTIWKWNIQHEWQKECSFHFVKSVIQDLEKKIWWSNDGIIQKFIDQCKRGYFKREIHFENSMHVINTHENLDRLFAAQDHYDHETFELLRSWDTAFLMLNEKSPICKLPEKWNQGAPQWGNPKLRLQPRSEQN